MKTKIYYSSAVLFFLLLVVGLNNIYAQWSQWRGVNRDGICHEDNLLKEWPVNGPKRLWAVNVVGESYSSAVVNENIVYTVGRIDSLEYLSALDINGNTIWQKPFGRAHKGDFPESRCTPTIYKNMIYVFSVFGDFACLDSKTGDIKWKICIKDKFGAIGNPVYQFCESPLVIDDKVIITTAGIQTTLVALNYLTGETIWKSETLRDTCDYVSPIIIEYNDRKMILASTARYFFTADLNTGKIGSKINNLYGTLPILVNNTSIYCNDGQRGRLFSYDPQKNDFAFTWCDSTSGSNYGGGVVVGDKIFESSRNPSIGLHAVNINTGKIAFSNKTIKESSLIAAKDRIYAYDNMNGKVYLVKLTDNNAEIVGSFRVTIGTGMHLAHMSIANGILYIRHGKALMAYDIRQSSIAEK
ncbi:MAG: PQQ-binding-like beta-propeller repeat protein [Bacteroidales bacterium]|nr:PQQ-binding-like beta-propeller repeat protein [Bacteroidales bacterium]